MEIDVKGNGNRVAGRDYYESVEISEPRLWHLSDEKLEKEAIRCQKKRLQARKNTLPLIPIMQILAGIVGIGFFSMYSAPWLGIFELPVIAVWVVFMLLLPARKVIEIVNFEGAVIRHYNDRLNIIEIIKRDRE